MLKGLLGAVSGQPNVFSASSLKVSEQLQGNRYVGIGIQLAVNNAEKLPQITNPFGRGPAWRAGVRPGDLIVEVDGRDTRGVELMKIVDWLRGQEGTGSLRAILYMDEIFGFFPPVAAPPSKAPMLTLLKQARAFGLGVVLKIIHDHVCTALGEPDRRRPANAA